MSRCSISISLLFVVACFMHHSHYGCFGCEMIFFALESPTHSAKSLFLLSSWGTEYLSKNEKSHDTADWVPNDPRRHVEGKNGLDFYVHIDDTQLPSYLDKKQVITAITNAVDTWDNVQCSQNKFNLYISKEYNGQNIGYAEHKMSGGASGSNVKIVDIVFGGWLPPSFFTYQNQLDNTTIGAVTVLFNSNNQILYENEGEIAFAEIYFNSYFSWDILEESVPNVYDIETVALHELGHALSQSHFHPPGKCITTVKAIRRSDANEVAMAPVYLGVNHDLHGVDIAGHCQKWASWTSRSNNYSSSPSISILEQHFSVIVVCVAVFIGTVMLMLCCFYPRTGLMSMRKKPYHLAQSTDGDDDDES
eukprot:64298_1